VISTARVYLHHISSQTGFATKERHQTYAASKACNEDMHTAVARGPQGGRRGGGEGGGAVPNPVASPSTAIKVEINDVNSSGAEPPAAIKVAPATSLLISLLLGLGLGQRLGSGSGSSRAPQPPIEHHLPNPNKLRCALPPTNYSLEMCAAPNKMRCALTMRFSIAPRAP
jgi:hypothetical protein